MSIPGRLRVRTRDVFGPIEVYESRDRRVLAFGNGVEQSALQLSAPTRLVYTYTQAMFLALVWRGAAPRRAWVLGLGGGSLVRALHARFPACRITAVELRPLVVEIAHRWFMLPSGRCVRVETGDAVAFVRPVDDRPDLIFLDLYDAEGMDERQLDPEVLAACADALAPGGILAANLWRGSFDPLAGGAALDQAFGAPVLGLSVTGGNVIVLGFRDRPRIPRRETFLSQARRLGAELDIPLERLARQCWRENAERLAQVRHGLG